MTIPLFVAQEEFSGPPYGMVTVGLLRRYWNYTQNSLRTPNWYWHNILSLCNMVPCIRCWIKTLHPRLNDDNFTAASAGYACILHSQIEINRRFLCTQHPISQATRLFTQRVSTVTGFCLGEFVEYLKLECEIRSPAQEWAVCLIQQGKK